jgi:hypothetical protein
VGRKQYQPSVVAHGVAMRLRGATLDQIAALLACSRRTVGRWVAWLESRTPSMLHGAWRRFASRVCALLKQDAACAGRVPAVAR